MHNALVSMQGRTMRRSVSNMLDILWLRSWSYAVVAVREGAAALSFFGMAPFSNSSGLCGQGGANAFLVGTVNLRDTAPGR